MYFLSCKSVVDKFFSFSLQKILNKKPKINMSDDNFLSVALYLQFAMNSKEKNPCCHKGDNCKIMQDK